MNAQASRDRRDQRIAFYEAEERVAARTKPASDFHQRLAAFPDPWLFDSEKLVREIDRCRELVLAIPNTHDRHATHFARENAVTALYNLRETLRYLLAVTREGQREFARKAAPASAQKNAPPIAKRVVHASNVKRAQTAG